MKKILLLMMCCPAMLAAQNGVTVSNLNVAGGTVTFNVSWNDNQPEDFLWSDTVWVFVDYNNGAGKMERLLLEQGATLTSTSPGGWVKEEPDNNTGVWVVGNARNEGSFSATVQLLTATANLAGVCAYASNYPPVGEYTAPNTIKFTGTPVYNLVLKHQDNETDTIYRVSGGIFDLPENYTLLSFSDATGAPGTVIVKCHAPGATGVTFAAFNPCADAPYGSSYTLTDGRDGKQYKVKYMPDNRYWMVQDLKFGDKCNKTTFPGLTSDQLNNINTSGTYYGDCRTNSVATGGYYYDWAAVINKAGVYSTSSTVGCSGTSSGTSGTNPSACQGICPSGWHVPTIAEYQLTASLWLTALGCVSSTCWHSTTYWGGTIGAGWANANQILESHLTCYYVSTPKTNGQIYLWVLWSSVAGTDDIPRSSGGLVRCLMNY
jgi:uncharacterized protein (TIGR02145 family)